MMTEIVDGKLQFSQNDTLDVVMSKIDKYITITQNFYFPISTFLIDINN